TGAGKSGSSRNPAVIAARKNFVQLGQDFLWTEILFTGITVGNDVTASVHEDKTWNAVHHILLNDIFGGELFIIGRRPRHFALNHVRFHPELGTIATEKYDLKLRMLRRDPIVILHQMGREFPALRRPIRREEKKI